MRDNRKQQSCQHSLEQGRVPPQAIDLEEAVLGAMLLESDALMVASEMLTGDMFYKETHRVVFRSILTLYKENKPVDLLTVVEQLKTTGDLDRVGGAYYISQLTNRVASSANVEYHSRIVAQKYMARELIRIGGEVARDAFDETIDVFDTQARAEKMLLGLSESYMRGKEEDRIDVIRQIVKDVECAFKNDEPITGVPSGIPDLDKITSGFQDSDVIVLAARPGMGKTALALAIAKNAASLGYPVGGCSMEMSTRQLYTRLIAGESEITNENLRRGNLESNDWERLNKSIGVVENLPIIIDDTPALNIFELRSKLRRMVVKHGIKLAFIDYIQLMRGDAKSREQEIAEISRSIKATAKELNIPIIEIAQLSRAVEIRGGDKIPILSDLRESGAIEQDADIVLFLYSPEYYGITKDESGNMLPNGKTDIIIAKHRNGRTGAVSTIFEKKYSKFLPYKSLPDPNYTVGQRDFYEVEKDDPF